MPFETRVAIPADHPAFQGHFPGNPLLPGVALLAEVIEAVLAEPALRERVGPQPRIGVAKFLAPVRPGAVLGLQLRVNGARVHFDVHQLDVNPCDTAQAGRLTASGHFEPAAIGGVEPAAGAPAESSAV